MQTGKTQQIVLHVFPWEIDEFDRFADLCKANSKYLAENDNIILDVSLNISDVVVNWKESKIPSEFYVDKFNSILKKFDWNNSNIVEIVEDDSCLGCVDKRRNSLRQSGDDVDVFTWVDTDIVFSDYHLSFLRRTLDTIDGDYYIVSGQLPKMWDASWDILVHPRYIREPYLKSKDGYHKFDCYEINKVVSECLDIIEVQNITPFKFGGGFLTTISSKLLKFMDIPDSFGSYGLEDTFVMFCSQMMNNAGLGVNQYVMKNTLVSEDNLYKNYTHRNHLVLNDNWTTHNRTTSNQNFQIEIEKFKRKLV